MPQPTTKSVPLAPFFIVIDGGIWTPEAGIARLRMLGDEAAAQRMEQRLLDAVELRLCCD